MDVLIDFLEDKIINLLKDLKENHHVMSIKAEFEDEGASLEEISLLSSLLQKVGLDLTIKIGGCGALNDITQAKKIGVKSIVAPMIESSYALKKFIQSIDTVYEYDCPELYANIETISGYNNFDEISSAEEFARLSGIVLGRFDMAKSIGLQCKDCNGEQLFELVNDLSAKVNMTGKIFTVGGGVCVESLNFFEKISSPIQKFETRKVVFNAEPILNNKDEDSILKAINFEMLWLKFKKEFYGLSNVKDEKRISILEKRCKETVFIH